MQVIVAVDWGEVGTATGISLLIEFHACRPRAAKSGQAQKKSEDLARPIPRSARERPPKKTASKRFLTELFTMARQAGSLRQRLVGSCK